jgi:Mn-dependent DtxR family transcriptional regulator
MKKLTNVPNLTELTYRSIKEQVLEGTFREGTRLTEEQLANQLGISRSPVREALNRLEAEGLISIESRRGAYVKEFSRKEVSDLYEFREVLELHSIAAAVITSTLLSQLAESIERTKVFLVLWRQIEAHRGRPQIPRNDCGSFRKRRILPGLSEYSTEKPYFVAIKRITSPVVQLR